MAKFGNVHKMIDMQLTIEIPIIDFVSIYLSVARTGTEERSEDSFRFELG